jgi:hypothetical protein
MEFIRDVNVIRMRQRRTLPGSKFFLHRLLLFPIHRLLLFPITLPCHSLHYSVPQSPPTNTAAPCFHASVRCMPI